MSRKLVPSTSPYAPIIGFSRAVRVGNHVSVGGTAPLDASGNTVGIGDPAAQTRQCLEIIRAALEQAGASLRDVVRTRTMPVDTVVQVTGFINKEWLIEIEVDAVVDEG